MDTEQEIRRREVGDLLRRARVGDRKAFDEIVDRLTPLVWNVARAQGLGVESAMDIVQTTWVTLLEEIDVIRSPEALPSWLITVTRRNARHLRAAERKVDLLTPDALDDEADTAPSPDTEIAEQELYRCLRDNLEKLPEACQELLRILAFTGHTNYQEVVQIRPMPKGSIGPTRIRCLKKLKELLEADPRWSV